MKNLLFRLFLVAVFFALTTIGCGNDRVAPPVNPDKNETNRWIYEQMAKNYLYNDYIKGLKPNYELSADAFFKSLLSSRPGDNDGKHPSRYEHDYFYSTLEHKTTKTVGIHSNSYGIEYVYYTDYNKIRVLYVAHHSAAARAGVKRGDWIEKIDGEGLSLKNYKKVESGNGVILSLGEISHLSTLQTSWVSGSPYTVEVEASSMVVNSPVYRVKTPDELGIPGVGYLAYHRFEKGTNGAFDREMITAFEHLKAARVRDLVLDLRYNPGGHLSSAVLLASLIAPRAIVSAGEVFGITQSNSSLGRSQEYKFSNMTSGNLNLSRLYVLTGRQCASSSEAVVNGLRPFMEVTLIGTPTEGKNVGSYSIPEMEPYPHGIALHPITVRIVNKENKADYANGFPPQVMHDEFNFTRYGIKMYEMGDPNDPLFRAALELIAGHPIASLRGGSDDSEVGNLLFSTHQSSIQGCIVPTPTDF